MKENKEVNDTNVGDIENSIEEDIKILEKFKNNEMQRDKLERDIRCGGWKIGYIYKCLELDNAIENILSDYKRVLKENELLRKDIEGWKKYCEEINEEQTKMSNKNCELEFEVEKLQKENEELKFKERSRIIGKYGDVEIHDVINRTLSNDYISVKKIKDKIEKLNKIEQDLQNSISMEEREEYSDANISWDLMNINIRREELEELIEEREEK